MIRDVSYHFDGGNMDDPNTSERFRALANLPGLSSGFEPLFQAAPAPFLVVTPFDYTIIAVNDEYLRATMTERSAILGRGLFDVFPDDPDDPLSEATHLLGASLERAIVERRTDDMPITFYPIPRPAELGGGFEERWWSPRNAPILGPNGDVACIIHHIVDVTARVKVEAALRTSERRFRALGTATSNVVYRMSADWKERMTLKGEAFTAEPHRDWLENHVPQDEHARVLSAIREAIDTKETFELEHRVFRADGSEGWTFSRAVPLFDDAGEITEWFGAAADISERKRAEQALRASEEKFRSLFESIDEGFCMIELRFDENGRAIDYRFIEVNPAFERQTGIANATGRWMREIAPNYEDYWFDIYGRVATTGEPIRFQHSAEELGRTFDVYAFRIGVAKHVATLFNDITDRMRADISLRESEQMLREAVRERDALLQEVHHRVKNNLQVITSLLEMQARQAGDQQAPASLSEARNRITAISAIHEMLYQSGSFSEVDLASYARRLLRHVVSLYAEDSRINASVDGDGIVMELTRAVPLALLLNELVSNAYKHAFPSRPEGELRVAFHRENGHIRLQVTDTGVGLPSGFNERMPATLGLQLVRMLTKQLGGTVTFRSSGGTSVEVRVPMDAKIG